MRIQQRRAHRPNRLCRPSVELLEERQVPVTTGPTADVMVPPPAGVALVQDDPSNVLPAVELPPSDGGVTPPVAGPAPGTGDASLPDATRPGPLNPVPGLRPGNPPTLTGDDLSDQAAAGIIQGAFPELAAGFARGAGVLSFLAGETDAALGPVLLRVDESDGGIGNFVVPGSELSDNDAVRGPDLLLSPLAVQPGVIPSSQILRPSIQGILVVESFGGSDEVVLHGPPDPRARLALETTDREAKASAEARPAGPGPDERAGEQGGAGTEGAGPADEPQAGKWEPAFQELETTPLDEQAIRSLAPSEGARQLEERWPEPGPALAVPLLLGRGEGADEDRAPGGAFPLSAVAAAALTAELARRKPGADDRPARRPPWNWAG